MISVCMAVRNGSAYIREQVESILPQLGHADEVVVVDDASQDETIAILQGYRNPRIRIIRQDANLGVVRSFVQALNAAKGDIIFLSDQDDVWHPEKVRRFLEVFNKYPDVTLVMSDLYITDASGAVRGQSKFSMQPFRSGILANILRNRYQGSAMAFRRSILEYCLPIPAELPVHDMWIGMVNQIVGKAAFIQEPLLFYRRHGKNDSPDRHAPWTTMLRWRWALGKNLVVFYLRHFRFHRSGLKAKI